MNANAQLTAQMSPYQPWLVIGSVFVLFLLLRMTRKGLRQRVDTVGYRLFHERGLLIWFWLNAPGVIIHEISHAIVVVLFSPFGFRVTSITLFRIKPTPQPATQGNAIRRGNSGRSLQLGEVQYVRPQGQIMSYIGDGMSGIAPLFGGTAAFILLYWAATGYYIWDVPTISSAPQVLQILRPGWPWWTLIFAPYLILTVTSELWPSRQDWRGARWFVGGLVVILVAVTGILWYFHRLPNLLPITLFVSSRLDFALLVLLALDLIFLFAAEVLVRVIRGY